MSANEATASAVAPTTLEDRYPELLRTLTEAPIVDKGDYDYFVHPLSDGIPNVTKALLDEATAGIITHLEAMHPGLDGIDRFVTAEAMGLPLVTALTLATDIPFTTARKRAYGLPGEVSVDQATGYSTNRLHINDLKPSERVVIIDDVVSTGGTLRALAQALRSTGAEVTGVISLFSKDPDLDALATDLACPVRALVSCGVVRDVDDDGRIVRKHVVVRAADIAAEPHKTDHDATSGTTYPVRGARS